MELHYVSSTCQLLACRRQQGDAWGLLFVLLLLVLLLVVSEQPRMERETTGRNEDCNKCFLGATSSFLVVVLVAARSDHQGIFSLLLSHSYKGATPQGLLIRGGNCSV